MFLFFFFVNKNDILLYYFNKNSKISMFSKSLENCENRFRFRLCVSFTNVLTTCENFCIVSGYNVIFVFGSSSSPSPSSKLFGVGHPCPTPPFVSIFHISYAHNSSPHITLSRIQPSCLWSSIAPTFKHKTFSGFLQGNTNFSERNRSTAVTTVSCFGVSAGF